MGPMSASRSCANSALQLFPFPRAARRLHPPFSAACRKPSLDGQTTHYAEGPPGCAGAGGVLPPEMVGFDRGAEGGDR